MECIKVKARVKQIYMQKYSNNRTSNMGGHPPQEMKGFRELKVQRDVCEHFEKWWDQNWYYLNLFGFFFRFFRHSVKPTAFETAVRKNMKI